MWITNRERNPNLVLRNADDYYVPAHKNEANNVKTNPSRRVFLKNVKSALLNEIAI
jgi:hypothetical protein